MSRPEPLVVWGLIGVLCVEILVTYSRLPAHELYNVSGSGLEGGASRVLVFLNFPVALIAIAIVALDLGRLRGVGWRATAVLAIALCAVVFWPGIVDQGDLDARPVNVPAAIGVGLAFVLTFAGLRRPPLQTRERLAGDGARVLITTVAVLAAAPWIAAELGFYLDGVPVLGGLYRTGSPPHGESGLAGAIPSVHHGHHHGMDGVLLVVSALLLSRLLPRLAGVRRAVVGGYLALMLAYGAGNIANDFWLEQVVKRGWTTWVVPSVLEPRVAWAWGVIVAVALIAWWGWFRDERRRPVTVDARRPARFARRRP